MDWLQQSFQENTILWLLISSIVGGIIGASLRFLFDFLLPQQVLQRREIVTIKRKYTTPLLLAAIELRGRLDNMIEHIQAIEREQWLAHNSLTGYYFLSTLYVVGRFFAWLQILRRTVAFLDFTSVRETRQFEHHLRAIEDSFTSPRLLTENTTSFPSSARDAWVFTYWLQGAGNLMIGGEDDDYHALDYVAFEKNFNQADGSDFRRYFETVAIIFMDLRADEPRFKRVVAAHALVNAFVDFADPKHLRAEQRPDHLELLSPEEAEKIRTRIQQMSSDNQAS
jgi:hypothetical protein